MKKRIKDIFRPEIFAVSPDTPAAVAMDIMREKNISCIVIVEEDQPVGIFTERDIVSYMVEQEPGFTNISIAKVMTPDVHTVTPDVMLYEAYSVLTENLIRHLVVVDHENKAIGVITLSDLLDHLEYDYLARNCTVGQIMNTFKVTATAYDTVYSAAKAMADKALCFLIVSRQLQPLGVITERDIAHFATEGIDIENTMIKDVMSTPVFTIEPDQSAFVAAEKMHEYDIRHLVVVNGAGKAVGVVTQSDLIRGLESRLIDTLRTVVKEQGAELDQTMHQLTEKNLFLEAILNSAMGVGIAITGQDLIISHFSLSAELVLGITAAEVLGKDLKTVVEGQNIPFSRLEQTIPRIHNGDTATFTVHRRENKPRTIQVTLSGIFNADSLAGFLLLVEDITEKRTAEETMHRLASCDTLTGVANRAMFYEKLKSELARSHRNDSPFCLILMDVDNFKMVNAALGHKTGDRLLQEIARRLDGLLRESDTIARLGNDEFCFILVNTTTTDDALIAAEKIAYQLSPAFDLTGTDLTVKFSLGVALFPIHGEDEETLLRNADGAMNQAKELGRKNMKSNIVVA
ncbi:MAG: hypothetical protein VR65_01850 [Desulfobulbaceae bacterium BRH_c16a]|nr:MAG: hypothetical protein VR65_01850 [Desulfobulbaceae bacterium BRH_c16a]